MHTDIHAWARTCIHPLTTFIQTDTDIHAHVRTCIHPHMNADTPMCGNSPETDALVLASELAMRAIGAQCGASGALNG